MLNFICNDEYLKHDTGSGHPENSNRYSIVKDLLYSKYSGHKFLNPRKATIQEISLVHDRAYVEDIINKIPKVDYTYYDPDTVASPTSLESYLLAAGGSILAFEDVCINNAINKNVAYFCAHRPPGHHAEFNKAMGFGVFNNVAISASFALKNKNINKILIVDFDVHHGNGTQHTFENNLSIFYASSHQFPFYPGSGSIDEVGIGNIFNCPLPSETSSENFRNLFNVNILSKIHEKFDLIYFSAGFDAHYKDPLATINLQNDDFYWITDSILNKFGGNIPVISVLEGGYSPDGLRDGLDNHLKALYKYTNNE